MYAIDLWVNLEPTRKDNTWWIEQIPKAGVEPALPC